MGYIYKITNTVSKKCYIGESKEKDIETRWKGHKYAISRGEGCPALQNAVIKHGWDAFTFEVLIICFDEDRFRYEKEYIKKYNSMVPNGYNLTEGGQTSGNTGQKHTEETKKKISAWSKEYHKDLKVKERKSKQMKERMKHFNVSESMFKSEKWQKALSEKRIGYANIGKHHSEERKYKLSESLKEYYKKSANTIEYKNNRDKHKLAMRKANGIRVSQFTKDNILIQTFDSIIEASISTGINKR
jgi:group I intron endonuclease